jgi:hypothetical protein
VWDVAAGAPHFGVIVGHCLSDAKAAAIRDCGAPVLVQVRGCAELCVCLFCKSPLERQGATLTPFPQTNEKEINAHTT